jgi:GNAT superfamily N-acetyltransferase
MVRLSAAKRAAYAEVRSPFWRPARGADAAQAAWFERLVARDEVLALVVDGEGGLDGFLLGVLASAPPVYDPGGLVCAVDDFCVRDPSLWPSVGAALLDALRDRARTRGAALVHVVCGAHDAPKRALLAAPDFAPTSTWFVAPTRRGAAP